MGRCYTHYMPNSCEIPETVPTRVDACLAGHVPAQTPWVISVTGSGGKTTMIEQLSQYWERQGLRVLVTTTTKMAHPTLHDYPFSSLQLQNRTHPKIAEPIPGATVLYGISEGVKIAGVSGDMFTQSITRFDRVLVEADGARNLPLKIHAVRDPVIPRETTAVIALMGMQALGKRLDDRVMYLCSRYRIITGDRSAMVTPRVYRRLLEVPEGVFKQCGDRPTVVCCNQSDTVDEQTCADLVEALAYQWTGRDYTLLCCSMHAGRIVTYREIGGSERSEGVYGESV